MHQPELGTRRVLHAHRHRSAVAANQPQQHPGGRTAQVVSTLPRPQRQRIDHHQLTVLTRPRRLQHQPDPIPPRRRPGAGCRRDQEMAGCVVEEPPEHRRRVEAGQAEPVHRTGSGHQGRRHRNPTAGHAGPAGRRSLVHPTAFPGRAVGGFGRPARRRRWPIDSETVLPTQTAQHRSDFVAHRRIRRPARGVEAQQPADRIGVGGAEGDHGGAAATAEPHPPFE